MQSVGIFTLMGMRIDQALAERGIVKSRSRAKLLLKEGKILLNGIPCTKPSANVEETDTLSISGEDIPYVGRGGLKLEEALRQFPVSLQGRICMDIGASTGGFTDCMLQNGAAKVYAVDVGHDQLDTMLRQDHRVVCMEGTDIRNVETLPEIPDFISIDVSFISLQLVLPSAYRLLGENGACVALIKPQFEAGKQQIGKHGIVRSAAVHRQVLEQILGFSQSIGFSVAGLCPSPIRGGSGNTEYLAYLTKNEVPGGNLPDIPGTVNAAGLYCSPN